MATALMQKKFPTNTVLIDGRGRRSVRIYGNSIEHSFHDGRPEETNKRIQVSTDQAVAKALGMVTIYGSIPHYYFK